MDSLQIFWLLMWHPEADIHSPRMEEKSESCFCSETVDIILGIVPGELHHMNTVPFNCITKIFVRLHFGSPWYVTSNTVALSHPWGLLLQAPPCSALCSFPSSSLAAAGAELQAWPLDLRRIWRWSPAAPVPNPRGSTCLQSKIFSSGSCCGLCRQKCFHLEEKKIVRYHCQFQQFYEEGLKLTKHLRVQLILCFNLF